MLVDFMIIGAQKCGTTTLANQLSQHPSICFCRDKEPGYFNSTPDWKSKLGSYHQLYAPLPGQLTGEASTMYTFLPEWPDTHLRLHEYNPNLKLIYVMRHPVERIISNYAHRLVRSTVNAKAVTAVFSDPVYINRSRYGLQLRPYLELFPRDQLLLIIFEEFIQDPRAGLLRISKFLGIDPAQFEASDPAAQASHRSVGQAQLSPRLQYIRKLALVERLLQYGSPSLKGRARAIFGKQLQSKPNFSPELRRLLWRFVEDDVSFVESLMGRKLDIWRQEV